MKRIASIDILRALTMFLMIVVNDYAGMGGLPHWMHHAATDEDMLGFSDLVFPAFLFCVGLSIPFAIGARYRKGDNMLQVLGHVCSRTLALVIMGIFSMNMRGVEAACRGPSSRCWPSRAISWSGTCILAARMAAIRSGYACCRCWAPRCS